MAYLESMPKAETIQLREKHIGSACQLFFRNDPLKIVRAEGQYMYDETGQQYLDCINNVAHVGHCHGAVVEAARRQMSLVATNCRFLHDALPGLAARLARSLPAPLSVAFLTNSGSEANDLALRLARAHTRREDVVVLDHAYHGHLNTLIAVSPYKHNLPGAPRKPDWVHVAPVPDTYRGVYRRSGDNYGPGEEAALAELYAQAVRRRCEDAAARAPGGGVAAFLAESFQSCGGQVLPPAGYLPRVYEYVRAAGGVCIADEVQTGFGRVGSHMWAFEALGVVPDIVTLGKPMGNGHPVAAVLTTPAIAKSFADTGVEYFNTYGGNPVSCAAASAVLDVLEREALRARAGAVGARLLRGLRGLRGGRPAVGDVRGRGLFLGVELVQDRARRTPAAALAEHIVHRMRECHILVSRDGPDGNVLKLKPPLVFSAEDADRVVHTLGRLLGELGPAAAVPRPRPLPLPTSGAHAEPTDHAAAATADSKPQLTLQVRVTSLPPPAPCAAAPPPRAAPREACR